MKVCLCVFLCVCVCVKDNQWTRVSTGLGGHCKWVKIDAQHPKEWGDKDAIGMLFDDQSSDGGDRSAVSLSECAV